MPVFRLSARDPDRGHDHTLFVEAHSAEQACAFLATKGFDVHAAEVVAPESVPPGAGLQRVPAPPMSLRQADPHGFRLRLVLLGALLGAVLALGVTFVYKARQHLLRSDLNPKVLDAPGR